MNNTRLLDKDHLPEYYTSLRLRLKLAQHSLKPAYRPSLHEVTRLQERLTQQQESKMTDTLNPLGLDTPSTIDPWQQLTQQLTQMREDLDASNKRLEELTERQKTTNAFLQSIVVNKINPNP